jgi:CBS domain containing-hemolysin-like protein
MVATGKHDATYAAWQFTKRLFENTMELNPLFYLEGLRNYLWFDAALLTQPGMIVQLTLQAVLFMASAFFSSSEVALFSLSKFDLQHLRRTRHPRANTLHDLLEQPRRLIISILCGNELINVAATANMTGILVTLYGDARAGVISMFVMVPLLLLFGEVTPKTIAVNNPIAISTRVVAGPMSTWIRLISPVRWVVRLVSDRLTTLIVGEETDAGSILRVDEFRTLVREVQKVGELNLEERVLIDSLLEAGATEIVEIMIPRTRTLFLDAELRISDMLEQVRLSRYARVPVFRNQRDNLVGFVHAEDLMRLIQEGVDPATIRLSDILHPPVVVPPTKKVPEMFDFFRTHEVQAAMVVNEFGGVDGLITINGILDFIFGPVTGLATGGEHYEGTQRDEFEVPGEQKLTVFNNLTNFGITDPRMTTVAGVIFRHLDRLPEVGDEVVVDNIRFKVLAMDGHRISRVLATRHIGEEAAEAPADTVTRPGPPDHPEPNKDN